MKRAWLPLVLIGVLTGCADPTSVDALQIAVVIIDDVTYSRADVLDAASAAVGEEYTRVTRYVDCSKGLWTSESTWVSDYCPLENGESNFLPQGTPIYRIQGVEPSEGVTVYHGEQWEVLRPVATQEAS